MNQWRMPFASFIGVNHHSQSILLGCALLTSEDIKTYAFVFRTWLTSIGETSPTTIFTDQCKSIKAAIRKVLPNTVHIYCIWYIFTKLLVKFRGNNYKRAKAPFKAIIFDIITIVEFENKWHTFIEEYDVGRRIWFQSLYSEQSKWVLVFLKHYFWAGIVSTQRCESMHAFFDGYISVRGRFVDVEGPRSIETDLHIRTPSVKTLGDGDPDTMMYMTRDKAVKVGVTAGDGVVEEVEEVGYVVVEEVDAMI
ncbi:protein FAR-RED IMPAIRED RESPONSE 1-like [Capsicum annuum]|uniref:protein FAR-RED IMPAIRED RESPONSE 1-like n=1 Tax=Capsicum annuum TaxID=4072 RepID=UPI001FB1A05A|nr:protein FAR-RED IMPAIRED RESPONSE 1-like [Capsicum annuum]